MISKNYIKIELPSRSVNEGIARSAVASFAAQLDPTLEELGDVKTAVSEAVTNAIVHAYPDSVGRISVRARILREAGVEDGVGYLVCNLVRMTLRHGLRSEYMAMAMLVHGEYYTKFSVLLLCNHRRS